jgi:ABC-type antimicrobial peptide transport system permease subunit
MTRGVAGRGGPTSPSMGASAQQAGPGGLDPMLQQMLMQEFGPGQSDEPAPSPRPSRRYEEEEEEDDYEPRRRRRSKRRSKRRDDDDDDDDDDNEEDDEDKSERLRKEAESKLAQVNKKNQRLYNIDKENAIKFKKAYYEGHLGDIKKFNVQINYNGVNATIYKIKKKNNKIFSVFIMINSQSTEIARRQLMINGSPVTNLSIINKIMEECYNKAPESE